MRSVELAVAALARENFRRVSIALGQIYGKLSNTPKREQDAFRKLRAVAREMGAMTLEVGCRIGPDTMAKLRSAVPVLTEWVEKLKAYSVDAAIGGYVPAFVLARDHGIERNRLSEAKTKELVRWKKAPAGIFDEWEGRAVRILYNKEDALKHCLPKRTPKSSSKQLPSGG